MNTKRLCTCLCLGSLLAWTAAAAAAPAGSIQGNSQLLPAPNVYTVLAVPSNWRTDPASQDLVNGFSTYPNLAALRQRGELNTYSATSPEFQQSWESRCPEVAQGKPVVLVMQGEDLLYKRSGASAARVNTEVGEILLHVDRRRPFCPNCPRPQPTPTPTPVPDAPKVAPLPDTPIAPPPTESRNILGLGLLLGAVAGLTAVVGEFKARIR